MKALRQASEADKARISRKCNQLIVKAEEIKKSSTWPPANSDTFSRVPVSERRLSKHEELIILEGSRLHGFTFPPWTSEPDDSVFRPSSVDTPVYRYVYWEACSLQLISDISRDSSSLKLSDAQLETFAGWKRPREREDILSQLSGDIESDEIFMTTTKDIDLVQDITTDCSVVASLCAGTARASKGHSKVRLSHRI